MRRSAILRQRLLALFVASLAGERHTLAAEPRATSVLTRNAEARQWFEDARLGLFIHWGVDSLLGKGPLVMDRYKIPISEYEKLPPRFNPADFDPEAWVKTCKSAGVRYVTVTSKHHDGFCMFDSKLTRYDVVDATPFARDPLKELAQACGKHGLKLFFYYSLLDWHHPDYYPRGPSGRSSGRDDQGNWARYIAYCQGQVRELCTNYGPIGGIWFDGVWDRPDADWDLGGTYQIIHDLQPSALVGNNHHQKPLVGEDIERWEPEVRGTKKERADSPIPSELWLSLNNSYGYVASDKGFKSPEKLIHHLLGTASRGANLLLFIGPKPDGTLGSECSQSLIELGKWLDRNGDTVYSTRKGPIPAEAWGVSMSKHRKGQQNIIYLHVTNPKAPVEIPGSYLSYDARIFGGGGFLDTSKADGLLQIDLPERLLNPVDTIVVLTPKILSPDRSAIRRDPR